MKVVQGDRLSEDARSSHRGGTVSYVRLLEGEANTLENFSLVLARTPGRFSPRHRHNFEQFRLQLEGVADYGRTGKLKPGMLGYFPEGVHYGPQTQGEDLAMLVLQCGGASGGGYLGRDGEMTYAQELSAYGEFRDGVFHRNPDQPGKRNVDAFQAIWEYVNGRELVYPKPRYDKPILMHPENFDWLPSPHEEGVATKFLGAFTECETAVEFIRINSGSSHTATGKRDIYYVVDGSGMVAGEPLRRMTTVWLDAGSAAEFTAEDRVEMVHFRLPDLSTISDRLGEDQAVAFA